MSQANKPRKRGATGELESLQHPLLGDRPTLQLIRPREEARRNGKPGFLDWWFLDRLVCLSCCAHCVFLVVASCSWFFIDRKAAHGCIVVLLASSAKKGGGGVRAVH